MPEIVSLKTSHYELIICSEKIDISRQRLDKTLHSRGKACPFSIIYFSPDFKFKGSTESVPSYPLNSAIFFENRIYDIEILFQPDVAEQFENKLPLITHRLKSVEEAFHYNHRTGSLRATINTGNNIGWFKFNLLFTLEGNKYYQSFSFEVLPVKMDLSSDLSSIYDQIDREYPLWRYSISEKTQQQMKAVKKPHPQFLLMWLAQFERYREGFIKGLRFILNSPHSRLLNIQKDVKMDRLKGRLSPHLANKIKQSQAQGVLDKRFTINSKKLSLDTVENRFIKHIISTSIQNLYRILNILDSKRKPDETLKLSDSFYDGLHRWQKELRNMLHQPFFREIGDFKGISRESLVLQQKPGYSRVYRVWQQLKWYLVLLDGQSTLSFRNVAELYEIWCFLEIRRILLEIGFIEKEHRKAVMVNSGLEVEMKDGMAGAFKFSRSDGIKLRLAHEPVFGKRGAPIKSWLVTQKPDILLEATFPDGCKFIWLFDAKYRIKDNGNDIYDTEAGDMVPDDAINQMHRYRDALIYLHRSESVYPEKSRPIFGAFALYPGFYDQKVVDNPYREAIEEIGIGAFSLLPGQDNNGSFWLNNFINEKFTIKTEYSKLVETDSFFVEEAPRIPYSGTKVNRYKNLTIVASHLGSNRKKDYTDRFIKGDARYYHIKSLAFNRQKFENKVVNETEYLAIAVKKPSDSELSILFVYPIESISRVKRSELTEEHTGTNKISNPDEAYWLFKLGKSLQLKSSVTKAKSRHFRIKLVDLEQLSEADNWEQLNSRYESLRV